MPHYESPPHGVEPWTSRLGKHRSLKCVGHIVVTSSEINSACRDRRAPDRRRLYLELNVVVLHIPNTFRGFVIRGDESVGALCCPIWRSNESVRSWHKAIVYAYFDKQ